MSDDPRGYVHVTIPGHPLAKKGGRVARHRQVLWDALGQPDVSACYNCRWPLPWIRPPDISGRRSGLYVVNVDHINHIPGDDRLENLRPACSWCNRNRSWAPFAPTIWQLIADVLCAVPPWDRPDPRFMLAAWAEKAITDKFRKPTWVEERALDVLPVKDGLVAFFDELEKVYDQ